MEPTTNDSAPKKSTLGGRVIEDRNTTSPNAQDETLLKALQDLIVRVIAPKQTNDTTQIHLGPEAGKLIIALQEFISSIVVHSQSGAQNVIEVSLDEEEDKLHGGNLDDKGIADKKSPSKGGSLRITSASESGGSNPSRDNNPEEHKALEKPQPTFKDKVMKSLREHVFNTMPIRLLCFEPHGESSFQISLLERGAIHARLASGLQQKITKASHLEETQDKNAIERLVSDYARYAILSHTWLRTAPGEVTFGDWNKGLFDAKDPGYRKLVNFCKAAWKNHGLTFGWMDTVCINKESSSELDESIRSMYNWYSRAAVCLIYLAETDTLSNMYLDPWFTRGWTLQELLAPDAIKFYNGHWKQLVDSSDNDKKNTDITTRIKQATTISDYELDPLNIHQVPISRRMQLAANREVTREEDTAYSLMGIFNVSISTAYGEGASRAFLRLLQEILVSCDIREVLDIFNWAGKLPYTAPYTTRILPPSPGYYTNRSSEKSLNLGRISEPPTLSTLGLRVRVLLMPAVSITDTKARYGAIGDYNAIVRISPVGDYEYFPNTYHLLDNRVSGPDGPKGNDSNKWNQMTFAVLNFNGELQTTVQIPKTCLAKVLWCHGASAGYVTSTSRTFVVETKAPVVFDLSKRSTIHDLTSEEKGYWEVKTDYLAKHGMQLVSMHL